MTILYIITSTMTKSQKKCGKYFRTKLFDRVYFILPLWVSTFSPIDQNLETSLNFGDAGIYNLPIYMVEFRTRC